MTDLEGGFLRQGESGANQNFTANGKRGPKERVMDSITPLLIKWLKDGCSFREGDIIRLDGFILDKIVVVGRVVNFRSDSTKTFVTLDDGTDSLKMISNKKHDEEHSKILKDVELNAKEALYLKVILDVNFYQNEALYTPIKVSQVKSHNYIVYHILNCLQAQKVRIKGFPRYPPQDDRFPNTAARKSMQVSGKNNTYTSNHETAPGSINPDMLIKESLMALKRRFNRAINIEEIVGELSNKINRSLIVTTLRALHEANEIRKMPGLEAYDFY